jgi:DNA-binding response OmpR family regulator
MSTYTQENKPVRMLIVDDEPGIYLTLARVFNTLGYQAEVAASGEEALALLQRERYDLIILDMVLPDMNGVEVMQRAHRILPELLIIILTGHATLESALAAIKSEAVDYLIKPVSVHNIVNVVVHALQERNARLQKMQLAEVLTSLQGFKTLSASELTRQTLLNRSTLVVPPVKLDWPHRLVTMMEIPERLVKLTRGESAVLACLMTQPGHPISCQQLVQFAWGEIVDNHHAENIIRPCILRLRRKLEHDPHKPVLIQTIRQSGYLLTSTQK